MFGLFKKQNDEAMNIAPKVPDLNTMPGWRTTEGTDKDVAMSIYQSLLRLDSSDQLLLRIKAIPGFQFKVTKERV